MRINGIFTSIAFAAVVGLAGPVLADSTFKVRAEGSFLVKHDMAVIPFTWKSDKLFEGKNGMEAARDAASKQEAKIIALRLGPPPAGFANWSLRLLAERVVELAIVPAISYETVRRTLKKTG